MGAERDTSDKQSRYLLGLATRFQQVSDLAIKAHYGGDEIFDSIPNLRLATDIVGRNEHFSTDMQRFGHQYRFKEEGATEDSEQEDADPYEHVNSRRIAHVADLEEIVVSKDKIHGPSNADVFSWLRSTYKAARGFELGTFDPSLLTVAMRQQSSKWPKMASGYISDAVAMVHGFVTTLLEELCRDEQVHQRLLSLLLDELLDRYRKSLAQVNFLVDVELAGVPMTLNYSFTDSLDKR